MKRLLTVLLAVISLLICAVPAFADDPQEEVYSTHFAPLYPIVLSPKQAFDLNVDNCNIIFDEQQTAPTWLFTRLKEQGPGASMTLKAELYHLTFYADDVKDTLITGLRYNLKLTLRSKNLVEHETYFGIRTPKYEITLEGNDPLPTSKVVVTLPIGRFLPTSKYYVYKVEGSGKYLTVHEELVAPKDGSVSFELYEPGTYLLSNGKLGDHNMGYRSFPTIDELRAGMAS